jgi:hypothetical protein
MKKESLDPNKFNTAPQCVAKAEAEGLVAFFAPDNWLFLDLDVDPDRRGDLPLMNEDVFFMLADKIKVLGRYHTTSKSGRGMHVYIELEDNLDLEQRATLQAALGSDPKKEALTILQGSGFTCLFETQVEAIKVPAELRRLPKNG